MSINNREIEEMLSWANRFTHWNKLRSIQNSKIISSTYVWLFVVPLAAKFLSKINDSIKITFDGNVYEFILKLPFSWEVFFYSSLCFVIGNVIFVVLAPELIKEFKDYGEYIGSKRNINHLTRYMPNKYKDKSEYLARQKQLAGIQNKDEENEFWKLYDFLNEEYTHFRYVCAFLYSLGFALFAWVVIKNIIWVLTH
jgi:hypothetical protein